MPKSRNRNGWNRWLSSDATGFVRARPKLLASIQTHSQFRQGATFMTKCILLAAFLAATQAHAASEPCYCENPVASPKGGIK